MPTYSWACSPYNISMTAEDWMHEAIACAKQALADDEVPIGCIIVHLPTNRIIGRGFTQRETNHDPKAGAVRTLYQLCDDPRLNHRVEVIAGVLAEECAQLLRDFFARQRQLG